MNHLQRLEIASNQTRFDLLKSLIAENGGYATKLSTDFKIERKTISFHLQQLEKAKLVEHKFVLLNNRAVKNYKITPIGKRVYEYIRKYVEKTNL